MRDKLGVCQWFHYECHDAVDRAVRLLEELGIRHFRTGVSWADYHRPGGKDWYDYQMEALSGFEVLLSVWHTPPSIAEGGTCASPPRRLEDYADFIEELTDRYGDRFAAFELWNEPNNKYKWDFHRFDPDWSKLGRMLAMAGERARRCGKPAVLGGMIPVDPSFLRLLASHGAVDAVDVVAVHGFPEMWWDDAPCWDWYHHWHGWSDKLASVAPEARGRPIWITETGLATWDLPRGRHGRYRLQAEKLEEAAAAPADRVYGYSLEDLDPAKDAIEGFHVDENEYHLGLVSWYGERKPAWYRMKELLQGPAAGGRGVQNGQTPKASWPRLQKTEEPCSERAVEAIANG